MPDTDDVDHEFLTSREVAELFGVGPETVRRWADEGHFTLIKTLGGHRRFCKNEVKKLLQEQSDPRR